MYKISKRIEIAGSHKLKLDYDSPCQNVHGHNWIITVEIMGRKLNQNGMLVDFKDIKNVVNKLDHAHINDVIDPINPTAENIAKWIAYEVEGECTGLITVSKVTVQESEGNIACFIP
ncbi:MAG: 6-pyruvoyl trahydropterin synthase family protein [Candidatus Heimdallarchaeaceae archaeon]